LFSKALSKKRSTFAWPGFRKGVRPEKVGRDKIERYSIEHVRV
jgi:hypothetical protein